MIKLKKLNYSEKNFIACAFEIQSIFVTEKILYLSQVLHRVFPVARGLYEDKVASFWCAISVVVKLQQIFPTPQVAAICAVTTLLAVIPSNFLLLRQPNSKNFVLSLFISSLSFFLFSYHVHEKSILLPAMSAVLLLPHHPTASAWFLSISTYSLLPLMVKDGLVLQWVALHTLFVTLAAHLVPTPSSRLIRATVAASFVASCMLVASEALVAAPQKFPHLYPLLNSVFSCAHFIGFLVYFYRVQFKKEKLHSS